MEEHSDIQLGNRWVPMERVSKQVEGGNFTMLFRKYAQGWGKHVI